MPKLETMSAPPSNEEAERLVVGAALTRPEVAAIVAALEPDHFMDADMRAIAGAIQEDVEDRSEANAYSVADRLKQPSEPVAALADASLRLADPDLDACLRVLRERRRHRVLADIGARLTSDSVDGKQASADIASETVGKLLEVVTGGRDSGPRSLGEIINSYRGEPGDLIYPHRSGKTIPTNFPDIDDIMGGGLRIGDMTVLAARPGMGKSTLAMNLLCEIAKRGGGCILFSLEMQTLSVMHRLICSESSTPFEKFRRGTLTDEERRGFMRKLSEVQRWPLWIDDSRGVRVDRLTAHVRRLAQVSGVRVVCVDYMSLLQPPPKKRYETRTAEVSAICEGLVTMARECGVALLAVQQLNRNVERRRGEERIPVLSDLRESGSIEQDAHNVWFVHRPELYNPNDASLYGQAELHVAKQRDGRSGKVNLLFEGDFIRFRNASYRYDHEHI